MGHIQQRQPLKLGNAKRVRIRPSQSLKRQDLSATSGAVLIEALIVSCLVPIMLAGGLYLHRLYSSQLGVLTDTQAEAWTQALRGCTSTPADYSLLEQVGSGRLPLRNGKQATATWLKFTPINAERSRLVQTPVTLANPNRSMEAEIRVICNERVSAPGGAGLDPLYVTHHVIDIPKIH